MLTHHTVTTLANGDALIVGGMIDDGTQTGTNLYPKKSYRFLASQGTLVDAGELAMPRAYHSATLLADGRVLVVGGERESGYYFTDTEIFDPAKPAGAAWSMGPSLFEARRGHSAILLASGELMISGGDSNGLDALSSVTFLKPGASSWTLGGLPIKEPRRNHRSTLLPGDKVLLSGGSRGAAGSPVYLTSLELHDPKTGASTLLPATMSKPRSFHSATLLDNGHVLLVGGYCGDGCTGSLDDLYDPKTQTLTSIAHPGKYPTTHIAAKLLDGRVLFAGNANGALHLVAAFNPSPPGWDTLPNMPHPRDQAVGATLKDGSVLVVGGVASDLPFVYATALERFFP
jgi:hypothetical protein